MKNEELQRLAHIYGANISRWPAALRTTAAEMFAAHPDILAQTKALDEMLDKFKVSDVNPALFDRVIDRVDAAPPPAPVLFFFHPALARGAMLAFSAILGLFLGHINFTANYDAEDLPIDLDHVIFGSTTFNEIML